MKKISLYIILLSFFFIQCSPKNTDQVNSDVEVVKEEIEEVVKEVEEVEIEEVEIEESVVAEPWRANAPGAGAARSIELGDYSTFDLDNGLKVIVVENHKLPRVSYQLSLKNKPINEKDEVGIVSLAGSLMATGTTTKSKAEIDESIDFIGARMSTFGGGMFGTSLKKHSSKLLDIMTDVLYNPSFPQEEFDKAITQSRSGLASAKTDPNSISSNVAAVINYGSDHPYGEIQTEKILDNLKLETAKNYYNTFFKPNNAYLVIVGDISPEEAKKEATEYFGKWKRGVIPTSNYSTPKAPTANKVAIANKDGAVQSVIRITYPVAITPGSEDQIPASVMNSILGGGIFSGRLMQNLREDKAYTYGARSSLSPDELMGNFNASASVRNEVTDSSVYEFLYEMDRLATEPVAAEDLQLVKNSMSGSFARSLESPQTIARFALNTFKYDLPLDYYNTYLQKLEAITVEDVQAMAQKYIRADKANIVVVGAADDISEGLKKFDADGIIDYYGPFGEKVDRSKMAVSSDVSPTAVVESYIQKIGGKAALDNVKTMSVTSVMNVMGQEMVTKVDQKRPNKFSMVMKGAGAVMQEQKYDGMKGYSGGMGGSQVITEGPQLEAMKSQAVMFSETELVTDKYELAIKGQEEVQGEQAYKVEAVDAEGNKKYYFFGVDSNLLLRTSESQEGPGGQIQTIVSELADYKAVNGILVPHTLTITGAAPFPLEMKTTSIEIDGDIPDSTFMIK